MNSGFPYKKLFLSDMSIQNIRKLNYTIDKSFHGRTIEAFLHSRGYTSSLLSSLKRVRFQENDKTRFGIEKNGKWAFTVDRLSEGDSLEISILEEEKESSPPFPFPLEIVYEDEDLLLLNKTAGIPCHPSPGHYGDTLSGAVTYYYKKKGLSPFVCRMIHRLDLETSGLLLIGKNKYSASLLNKEMQEGKIERTYSAICRGNPALAFEEEKPLPGLIKEGNALLISAPIYKPEEEKMLRCVDFNKGQKAMTRILSCQYFPENDFSLLELKLETGRTHQIRVHLSYISCPLLGDSLYGEANLKSSREDSCLGAKDCTQHEQYSLRIKRQALHSRSIHFLHPLSGKVMYFDCPLPKDMQAFLYRKSSFLL